jgi:hypothetical protein
MCSCQHCTCGARAGARVCVRTRECLPVGGQVDQPGEHVPGRPVDQPRAQRPERAAVVDLGGGGAGPARQGRAQPQGGDEGAAGPAGLDVLCGEEGQSRHPMLCRKPRPPRAEGVGRGSTGAEACAGARERTGALTRAGLARRATKAKLGALDRARILDTTRADKKPKEQQCCRGSSNADETEGCDDDSGVVKGAAGQGGKLRPCQEKQCQQRK